MKKTFAPRLPIVSEIARGRRSSLTLVDLRRDAGPGPRPARRHWGEDRAGCQQFAAEPESRAPTSMRAANADLATSEALVLARGAVDRAGDRTIGVLTKTDLMDPGTDCASILRNEVFPLRLGYVAVVCRGQRDLDEGAARSSRGAIERAGGARRPRASGDGASPSGVAGTERRHRGAWRRSCRRGLVAATREAARLI